MGWSIKRKIPISMTVKLTRLVNGSFEAFKEEINRLRWGDLTIFDPYFFPRVGISKKKIPQNSNAPHLLYSDLVIIIITE